MTNYTVKYGTKNDGPKTQTFTDKETAERFAESVAGKVIAPATAKATTPKTVAAPKPATVQVVDKSANGT